MKSLNTIRRYINKSTLIKADVTFWTLYEFRCVQREVYAIYFEYNIIIHIYLQNTKILYVKEL